MSPIEVAIRIFGPVMGGLVGAWVTIQGIMLIPYIALGTGVTIGTGAVVYHLRLRSRAPDSPTVETY